MGHASAKLPLHVARYQRFGKCRSQLPEQGVLTTTDRDVFELQETMGQFLFQTREIYVTSLNMEFGRGCNTRHEIDGTS